jgi:hypothetical protein
MKRAVIICIFVIFGAVEGYSDELKDNGLPWFSGGMMIHLGYSMAANSYGSVDGLVAGLGGRLHFEKIPYFRFGMGGAATEVSYSGPGLEGSYMRIGYGGLIVEAWYKVSFFKVALGLLAGYGGIKNLHIVSSSSGTQTVSYYDYNSWVFIPMVTMEFFVTKKFAVTVIFDWMMGTNIGSGFNYGPRAHVGVLFYR